MARVFHPWRFRPPCLFLWYRGNKGGDFTQLVIPERFLKVRYSGEIIPGHADALSMEKGANCQVFAYNLLAHFGKSLPSFRSSDLWEDAVYTRRVEELEPLDLLLFHDRDESFGAHVGVYLGTEQTIHLSQQEGLPVIWHFADFATNPRYKVYIGAKRVVC